MTWREKLEMGVIMALGFGSLFGGFFAMSWMKDHDREMKLKTELAHHGYTDATWKSVRSHDCHTWGAAVVHRECKKVCDVFDAASAAGRAEVTICREGGKYTVTPQVSPGAAMRRNP
jgi:hypothetical protein